MVKREREYSRGMMDRLQEPFEMLCMFLHDLCVCVHAHTCV